MASAAIALITGAAAEAQSTNSGLPRASWSSPIALTRSGSHVVTANTQAGTIASVDTTNLTVTWEFEVGAEPRSLALSPDETVVYVTSFVANRISAINMATGALVTTAPTRDGPYGVISSPQGSRIFTAESGDNTVSILDGATLKRLSTIEVEPNPRGLAISRDGQRLYVTHFLTGRLTIIDLKTESVRTTISTGGESNAAQFVAIHPSNGRAYIPHIRSRTSNLRLQFDSTIAPLVSVVDLKHERLQRRELLGLDTIDRPVNMPCAVDFSPNGQLLYVVNSGSNDLSIVDLKHGLSKAHVQLGDNPRGIVVGPQGNRAYVINALSEDLMVVDLERFSVSRRVRVSWTDLPDDVRRGQLLFYSSARRELARDQWVSCASCHLEGDHDARTWPMKEGPRNTPSIAGLANTAPYHWSGDRTNLFDFQKTIIGVQGGTGLTSAENKDLAAFLAYSGNEHKQDRNKRPALTATSRRGKRVFVSAGCAACHSGADYTDGKLHDIGTGNGPRETLGPNFDTPTLVGLRQSAPYLHDGRATSLRAMLTKHNPRDKHGVTSSLTEQQVADLVSFLRSLQ